jgi:hypothetical protein
MQRWRERRRTRGENAPTADEVKLAVSARTARDDE